MSVDEPSDPRARFFALLFHIDHAYDRLRRTLRGWLGIQRRLTVVPFRGYGSAARACVALRVQEDRRAGASPAEPVGLLRSAIASWKRYATVEIPGARVRLSWSGQVEELAQVADEELRVGALAAVGGGPFGDEGIEVDHGGACPCGDRWSVAKPLRRMW